MLLTLFFFLLLLLSVLWVIFDKKYDWETNIGALVSFVCTVILFLINIIALFTSPSVTRSDIQEFEAVRLTIKQQRDSKLSEYERVALIKDIVDKNQWLAKEQFWAKTIWLNWYYDKKILDVKPIE